MVKWSDAVIKRACNLRASLWSNGAIAMALGCTRGAVKRKFGKLRAADDVSILIADCIRQMALQLGAKPTTLRTLHALMKQEGFAAGLQVVHKDAA